jgi:hypothetical protein
MGTNPVFSSRLLSTSPTGVAAAALRVSQSRSAWQMWTAVECASVAAKKIEKRKKKRAVYGTIIIIIYPGRACVRMMGSRKKKCI